MPTRARLAMLRFALVALSAVAAAAPLRADDWPQWLGPQRDGVWRETGIMERFPREGPKVRWRTPIAGGYAGPAVAGGKERVLCLEEASGKILWIHEYPCTYRVGYPAGPRTTPVVHDGKVYTLG